MVAIFVTLLLLASYSKAVVFDGPCPIISQPIGLDDNHYIANVVYYTSVVSETNHLFYEAEDIDYQMLALEHIEGEWFIDKVYNGQKCPIQSALTPISHNTFRHSIRVGDRFQGFINKSCGHFWTRYHLRREGNFLLLWGCEEHRDTGRHEEGLLLAVLSKNATYRQNRTRVEADARSLLPVGRFQAIHLRPTQPKPIVREIRMHLNCRKLACKPNPIPDYVELLLNIAVGVAVVFCIIGAVSMNMNRE